MGGLSFARLPNSVGFFEMRSRCLVFLLTTALLGAFACTERVVVTTSIQLRTVLPAGKFNTTFIESVAVYVRSADAVRALELPSPGEPSTANYAGRVVEISTGAFHGDGVPEIRMRLAGNPFSGTTEGRPSFDLVFESLSAGTRPLALSVEVLRGSEVIALGSTDRTLSATPIVTLDGVRTPVELDLGCAEGFSCETGNHAPRFAPIGAVTVREGETGTVDLVATDPDGHAVTFSAAAPLPAFASLDARTGRLLLTPGHSDAGAYALAFAATDAGTPPLTTRLTLAVTVADVNRPPLVSVAESSPVGAGRCTAGSGGAFTCDLTEGQSFSLALAVTDDPGEAVAELGVREGLPAGSTLVVAPGKASGSFQWTPLFDQGRNRPWVLTFAAKDAGGAEGTTAVTVRVRDVNRPPTVRLTESQSVSPRCGTSLPLQCVMREFDTLRIEVVAEDDADESITGLAADPPAALGPRATFVRTAPGAATLILEPGATDAAPVPHEIPIRATDSNGATTTVKVLLSIVNANRPPVITLTELSAGGRCVAGEPWVCTIDEGEELVLRVVPADADPDDRVVLFTMSAPTATGATFSPDPQNHEATFRWRPAFDQSGGPYPVTFAAQDSVGGAGQAAVSIVVRDVNRAPLITLESGLVGSASVCKGSPAVCYVGVGPSGAETLLLRLSVRDPDGDSVSVRFDPSDLPQLGTVWDAQHNLLTFTVQDTRPHTFTASFTATDSHGASSLSARLGVVIKTSAPAQAPSVTLEGCPASVRPGESLSCLVRIDDPNPREAPLLLSASFLKGSSFSFDAASGIGTFTMVPFVTRSDFFQVDFTGTNATGLSVRVPYVFDVQSLGVLSSRTSAVNREPILDAAYLAPFLYVAKSESISIYDIRGSGEGSLAGTLAVPELTPRIEIEPSRRLLLVAGNALTFYDVGANPVAPRYLARYNFAADRSRSTVDLAQRTVGGTTYAFAALTDDSGRPDEIVRIRVDACAANPAALCPVRVASLSGYLLEPASGAPGAARVSKLEVPTDSRLVAVGPRGVRLVDTSGEGLTLLEGASARFTATEEESLAGRRFGVATGAGDAALRLTLPYSRITDEAVVLGLMMLDVSTADVLSVPVVHDLGAVTTSASRVGALTAASLLDPVRVGLVGDDGQSQGEVPLTGSNFLETLVAGEVGFAVTQTSARDVSYLTLLDFTAAGTPTKGIEVRLENDLVGAPAAYASSPTQSYLYVPRAGVFGGGSLEVYDLSSAVLPRIHVLGAATDALRRALVAGRYLVGYSANEASTGKRNLAVFDVGANAVLPPALDTVGFEVPLATAITDVRQVIPVAGSGGEPLLYFVGKLCIPSCSVAAAHDGVFVLAPGEGGLSLRTPASIDLGVFTTRVSRRTPAVQLGSTLLKTEPSGSATVLRVFDLTDPASPVALPERSLPLADVPADADVFLAAKDGVALLAWSGSTLDAGGVIAFTVDAQGGLQRRGSLAGVGRSVAVALESATRAWVAAPRLGLLRLDLSDADRLSIDGGQESPAPSTLLLAGTKLVTSAGRRAVVFERGP